jgi:hypothetical protein
VKNLKVISACFVAFTAVVFLSCQKPAQQETPVEDTVSSAFNILSDQEKSGGWELLFDGNTLTGWKRFNRDTIGPLWTVQDGVIVCNGEGLGEGSGAHGGSLITTRQFGNFDLTFDWKVSPGGNSGVLYHVVEKPEFKYDYETGPEYQVMDDAGWTGEKLKPEQMAGSNYDMYAAADTKKVLPADQWNTGRIIYENGKVQHWLNGEKVLEFDEASDDFKERYSKSKWVEYPSWNKSKTGAISLQDHGAPVYFRNIKIKSL